MTRKRYMKLVMSFRHGRNVAEHEALATRLQRDSYAHSIQQSIEYHRIMGNSVPIYTNSFIRRDGKKVTRKKRRAA